MKEIMRRNFKRGDLLYEFPAETRLTVYRRLDIITRRAGVFPMESNTKTIAKRARVGPRTPVVLTVKMLILMRKPSTSLRGSPIISLSYILKI